MVRYHFIYIFLLVTLSCSGKKEKPSTVLPEEVIQLKSGNYSIMPKSSTVEWIGKELSTKIHTGTLNINSGSIDIDVDNRISGKIEIDMGSLIVTDLEGRGKEALEGHLKSDDFFATNKFPKSTLIFQSNGIFKQTNQLFFQGDLIIKGISHGIEFYATLLENSNYLKANAKMIFDRSKYNVRFRSGTFFDDLGDKLILNDINVDVSLVAVNK